MRPLYWFSVTFLIEFALLFVYSYVTSPVRWFLGLLVAPGLGVVITVWHGGRVAATESDEPERTSPVVHVALALLLTIVGIVVVLFVLLARACNGDGGSECI